ncbi:molybdopterin converting factor small subunit [Murinocardiopsis flavida]|uniref:Molybdopterin converting factor small subunit n=1 Tax=Murinocardiopsis flavida TaxID=645275 RepID=A0A2P8DQU6_9ACTN|nr:MoaD/ThiS family protein [Murinocardiopsis flavida]PSK99593.1 molybdopterin converting factor small subunit [Murinocardiopsis flavida]
MASATIRYWAAAKEAAGTAEETVDGATLAEALDAVRSRHGANGRLLDVLRRSSFLVDEVPAGRRPHGEIMLADGSSVEVLPPFAGG